MHRRLVRHFFGRFFDTESLSPQGDPQAGVNQTLGILAVPSAFFVLALPAADLLGLGSLVGVRYMFVLYSMVVMGFVMVFEWDALFSTRATTRSLRPSRSAAVRCCLHQGRAHRASSFRYFSLTSTFGRALLAWSRWRPNTFAILTAHMVAVLAAGLFSALAIAAIHGVIATRFPRPFFPRASPWWSRRSSCSYS